MVQDFDQLVTDGGFLAAAFAERGASWRCVVLLDRRASRSGGLGAGRASQGSSSGSRVEHSPRTRLLGGRCCWPSPERIVGRRRDPGRGVGGAHACRARVDPGAGHPVPRHRAGSRGRARRRGRPCSPCSSSRPPASAPRVVPVLAARDRRSGSTCVSPRPDRSPAILGALLPCAAVALFDPRGAPSARRRSRPIVGLLVWAAVDGGASAPGFGGRARSRASACSCSLPLFWRSRLARRGGAACSSTPVVCSVPRRVAGFEIRRGARQSCVRSRQSRPWRGRSVVVARPRSPRELAVDRLRSALTAPVRREPRRPCSRRARGECARARRVGSVRSIAVGERGGSSGATRRPFSPSVTTSRKSADRGGDHRHARG